MSDAGGEGNFELGVGQFLDQSISFSSCMISEMREVPTLGKELCWHRLVAVSRRGRGELAEVPAVINT